MGCRRCFLSLCACGSPLARLPLSDLPLGSRGRCGCFLRFPCIFFSLSFFVFLFSFTPSLSRAFAIHYSLDATTCSGATETTASPTSTCGERDETAKPGALSSSLRSIQQTNHHKRRPSPAMSALEQLLALGIPEAKATYALDRFNGRIEHASDWVFGDVSESDASLPVSPMTSFLYPSLCSPGRRMGATHPTDACSATQSIYVHDDRARPTSFVNRSFPPPPTDLSPFVSRPVRADGCRLFSWPRQRRPH